MDDKTLLDKTLSDQSMKANICLDGLNKWLFLNKLHINIDNKTCYTIFIIEKQCK